MYTRRDLQAKKNSTSTKCVCPKNSTTTKKTNTTLLIFPNIDKDVADSVQFLTIAAFLGYAVICLILAVRNYTKMWMIIQYIKYCNQKKNADTVERELYKKVLSLYAVYQPMQFNEDFDDFIVD